MSIDDDIITYWRVLRTPERRFVVEERDNFETEWRPVTFMMSATVKGRPVTVARDDFDTLDAARVAIRDEIKARKPKPRGEVVWEFRS